MIIFHDHGTRYLGKMYNDDWMRDRGFMEAAAKRKALDLIDSHKHQPLVTIGPEELAEDVFAKMQKFDISQVPVQDANREFIGSISDAHMYAKLLQDRELLHQPIKNIMQGPFPIVSAQASIDEVTRKIDKNNTAVLVMDLGGNWHIITKYDVIAAMS